MTTIAWDGTTLAADRQAYSGSFPFAVTKIFAVRGHLVGASGDIDRISEMIEWFRNGAKPETFPVFGRSNDDFVGLLVIKPDRTVWKYERSPHPFQIKDRTHTLGSGREFAMAAMFLGKDAKAAVEVAMSLDPHTGIGVDTLTL